MAGRAVAKVESVVGVEGTGQNWFVRHWRLVVLLAWIAAVLLLVWDRWNAIRWFGLGDTDDNLRMMQVRGLLNGQGWFDLRQYRLDPPAGASVHWSRLVDLPIAGIMLALKPFMSGAMAEKVAVAFAPMLPMLVAFGAMAVTARRLIAPGAFALAVGLLLCAHSVRGMWVPLRIDHHGWQLALLSLALLGMTDRKAARGGAVLGLATAASLTIGLELLLYLAAAGALVALFWIRDRSEAPRLAAYGAALAGGCAAGYLAFASIDNRAAVCDALSPVWLSAMLGAGAVAVLLALVPAQRWTVRLAIALAAGAVLAAAFAIAWPHCLGRLEGVSPELDEMWLSRVREALPVYRHDRGVIAAVVLLPLAGLVGYGLMLWRERRNPDAWPIWAALGFLALIPAALLLWQTRAGGAAQLLAVPGATALVWILISRAQAERSLIVRVTGTVLGFALVSGILVQQIVAAIPKKERSGTAKAANQANAKCPTLAALRPIAQQPRGYVFTHVDLGPRLITVTHHQAVAGPYHRNQQAILDVMKGFRGTAESARATIMRRGIDYVLICPGLSESTVYAAAAPKGFYVQLRDGKVPGWLSAVTLPADSPYKMWRVVRP